VLGAILYAAGTLALTAFAYFHAERARDHLRARISQMRSDIAEAEEAARVEEAEREFKDASSRAGHALSDFYRGYSTPYIPPPEPLGTAPRSHYSESDLRDAERELSKSSTGSNAAVSIVTYAAAAWTVLLFLYFPVKWLIRGFEAENEDGCAIADRRESRNRAPTWTGGYRLRKPILERSGFLRWALAFLLTAATAAMIGTSLWKSRADEAAAPNTTPDRSIWPESVPPAAPSARPPQMSAIENNSSPSEHNRTRNLAETMSPSLNVGEELPGTSEGSWAPSELVLVKRWYELNRVCLEWSFASQGGDNSGHESVAGEAACGELEDLSERLRQMNICYGKEGQAQADMQLHRCGTGSEQL
jgi:hypothetical protein